MKHIYIILFLSCFLVSHTQSQPLKYRFGKTQTYISIKNERETKIEGTAVKVYDKLYQDSLEIPLNRYFKSDSAVVFVGVSFKYSLDKLYNTLCSFNSPITKFYDEKNKYFIIQGYISKAFVSRYCYYSKRDKLIYILNYTFLPNKKITLEEFNKIVNETVKK